MRVEFDDNVPEHISGCMLAKIAIQQGLQYNALIARCPFNREGEDPTSCEQIFDIKYTRKEKGGLLSGIVGSKIAKVSLNNSGITTPCSILTSTEILNSMGSK